MKTVYFFNLFVSTLVVMLLTTAGSNCPSSPAYIHAGCDMTITFTNTCTEVQNEISQRVNGQYNKWHDPHNNGTYSFSSKSDSMFELTRLTGDGKYTDKIIFTFASDNDGCKMEGCSQSQVFSIYDFSTNYCNLHDLYCADSKCHPFTNLNYDESMIKCYEHDGSQCTTV